MSGHSSNAAFDRDGRLLGDHRQGTTLDGTRIDSAEVVSFEHEDVHDIPPASEGGTYFAAGGRGALRLQKCPLATAMVPREARQARSALLACSFTVRRGSPMAYAKTAALALAEAIEWGLSEYRGSSSFCRQLKK